jgi:hypothetical protein
MVTPAPVTFSDDLGAERLTDLLGDDARKHVCRAAGGERHDHRDRPRRVRLLGLGARLQWQCGSNATASMSPFWLECS